MAVGTAAPPQAPAPSADGDGAWRPAPRRFTREEYYRMAAAGVFAPDERVEIIEGEVFLVPPPGPMHDSLTDRIRDIVAGAFGAGHWTRAQAPLSLGMASEPQPDVAVVRGAWSDYLEAHPTIAELVIEVAQTTLEFDRVRRGSLYAAARIPEYWIVNLEQDVLEVYRDPQPGPVAPFGASYGRMERLGRGAVISPLGAPGAVLPVESLLLPRALSNSAVATHPDPGCQA
ncbi:MAG: Uma2 family endonuclease [Armatimonadetes bacterium]|nr:Uma2 family endonuclease [Armatimonadota bacterium]